MDREPTGTALRSLRQAVPIVALQLAFPVSTALTAQSIAPPVVRQLQQSGTARVLVALKRPAPADPRAATIRNQRDGVLSRLGGTGFQLIGQWDSVRGFAGVVNAEALSRLRSDPEVFRVDLDVSGTGSLEQSLPQIGADRVQQEGVTGTGVTVAVLDSGIRADHPDFTGALVGEQCFCSDAGVGCCPNGETSQSGPGAAADDHGHGTNVTGILASRGALGPTGVAPGAQIVSVKVLDAENRFSSTVQVIDALDWVLSDRPDVDVVNMSLGTSALFDEVCDDAAAFTRVLADVIDALVARGVSVVVSAGNSSDSQQLEAPACVSGAISVGAVTPLDTVAAFSNSSSFLDILAPGTSVTASGLFGATSTFSGTSMASPHVAGVIALLLESDPDLAPAARRSLVRATGTPVLDGRNGLTFPRLDALAAWRALLSEGNIVFPQLALGGGFDVLLLLTNRGLAPWNGTLLLDGGEWPESRQWSLDGQDRTGETRIPLELGPQQTRKLLFQRAGEVVSGWLEIGADEGSTANLLATSFLYNYVPGGTLIDSTGVAPSVAGNSFRFPAEQGPGLNTGLAIRQAAAPVTFELYGGDGHRLETKTLSFDGAQFIFEIFDTIPAVFVGSVRISSDLPFHIVVLRLEESPGGFQLTSVPATPAEND